ncbi:DUF6151 family protein [Qipengyuania qiaonensis]|uniref:CENP-V/GFA domain-containing protein n=1 Tax=Qipengyuania qiaonensis TaxID=2867240 RepID=A0ABS7J529_9SPHN|nr:DUF6151 family protein [Qipengyuania qiaonensis]MBX7481396.1 hypothetical protein [Qipengyuania qiaonensis]
MSAPGTLPFACQCGTVTGAVLKAGPSEGDRVVCHCADCRDLVRHLRQEERVLDDLGGTDLYQSRCARVELHTGRDQLASLHMTSGKTLRWYASCCNSPLFNTYANGKVPYVTTILANTDGAQREALLGSPIGHVFPEQATGDASALTPMPFNRLMRRFFWRMIKDLLAGDHRRSALFDPKTLEPVVSPRRLTELEQKALGRA